MSIIRSVSSALPPHKSDNQAVESAARVWLQDNTAELETFQRFLSASKTETRYFSIPPEEVVRLRGSEHKAQIFERVAPLLAHAAAQSALEKAGVSSAEIDAIIFSSCTCPLIPAPDTYLVDSLGLRRDVVRIPAYQFGCAGGLVSAGIAHRLTDSVRHALVVSAELCSLVFQPDNRSTAHLVGAAIFGDGAAAAVVSCEASRGLEIIAHRSYLIPGTRHLMGYDLRDSGSHLRLDKALPTQLADAVPRLVDEFLTQNGLVRADIPWWLFHPGSAKILAFLEQVLELEHSRSHWAADVLQRVGNLSSASILFIVEDYLRSSEVADADLTMLLGVGPGLTIELILAKRRRQR